MLVKKQSNKIVWIALIILVIGIGIYFVTKIGFNSVFEWGKNLFNGIFIGISSLGTLFFILMILIIGYKLFKED